MCLVCISSIEYLLKMLLWVAVENCAKSNRKRSDQIRCHIVPIPLKKVIEEMRDEIWRFDATLLRLACVIYAHFAVWVCFLHSMQCKTNERAWVWVGVLLKNSLLCCSNVFCVLWVLNWITQASNFITKFASCAWCTVTVFLFFLFFFGLCYFGLMVTGCSELLVHTILWNKSASASESTTSAYKHVSIC